MYLVDLLKIVLYVERRHGLRHFKRDTVRWSLDVVRLIVEQFHPEVGQEDSQLRVSTPVQRVAGKQ